MHLTELLRVSVQQKQPNSDTTIRSCLLTSIQPLGSNKLFLNPVIQDYPSIRDFYLSVIKEPMSVFEIRQKLNQKSCKYKIVYEPLHDICLLTFNCRLFNAQNPDILQDCDKFEQAILQCINSFLFKMNCQQLSTYDDFSSLCMQPLQQIHVQKSVKQQKFERGTINQQVINDCLDKFEKLSQFQQQNLIKMLVFEMDNFQLAEDQKCVLQFDLEENPKQFWWFYENVLAEDKKTKEQIEQDEEFESEEEFELKGDMEVQGEDAVKE
uniref:Bromodomain-containing protein n=1 Tax=Trepomonas sp. PC1 TaxID=1076344 RepID=A0A146K6X0_9EUKA|eukprot:JAP92563.1 Bromodomain-containing protein [Trepomonas sp. PC1]